MTPAEGVALYSRTDRDPYKLFLPGRIGEGRGLNPKALYCAMRWDYARQGGVRALRDTLVRVTNPRNNRSVYLRPVDWGPNIRTRRIIDVSPEALEQLGCQTDDMVSVTWLPDASQIRV